MVERLFFFNSHFPSFEIEVSLFIFQFRKQWIGNSSRRQSVGN
jgi:hypothetical protein